MLSLNDGVFSRLNALKRLFFRGKPRLKIVTRWVVTPGSYRSFEECESIFASSGFKIDHPARRFLMRMKCSEERTEIQFASATLEELRLRNAAPIGIIQGAVEANGFQLCQIEDGPALRLFLKDQPEGEWLFLAMEATTDGKGCREILALKHDHAGLCLTAVDASDLDGFIPSAQFIFRVTPQVH